MPFAIVLVTEEANVFHQFTYNVVAIGDGFLFIISGKTVVVIPFSRNKTGWL